MASLDGPPLSAAAIVAIASAYLLVTRREAPAAPAPVPRWRLAGRLERCDQGRLRAVARAASRWSAAGRLDG